MRKIGKRKCALLDNLSGHKIIQYNLRDNLCTYVMNYLAAILCKILFYYCI